MGFGFLSILRAFWNTTALLDRELPNKISDGFSESELQELKKLSPQK
jgi:hypothetical protein